MARRNQDESVFVSFHHISRSDGNKFSPKDFEKICSAIQSYPKVDIKDRKNVALMRSGNLVPLTNFERLDATKAFGAFHATYSGHSYENNEKGTISSKSINVRKFYYILYLSKSGRIYIGAQYLGTFGGYGDVYYAVKRCLPDVGFVSTSIRSMSYLASDASPKEVRLTIQRPTGVMGKKPSLIERSVVSLQRSEKGSPFETAVKNRIFPIFKLPLERRKEALVKELQETGIFEFQDDELENCNIVIDRNGRQETVYLFDNGFRATKFHVEVEMTATGHPKPAPLREIMIKLLDQQIINPGKG